MAQAQIAMLSRHLVGAFVYFAESGVKLGVGEDEITVSETVKPDVSTNYELVPSLGCIEEVDFDVETESTDFFCPAATGGYNKTTEEAVVADYLDFTAGNANELIHRLTYGLASKITQGSGTQTPFANRGTRSVLGWIFLHALNKDGTTLLKAAMYGEVKLNERPGYSREYGKPVLRFQVKANSLNTIGFPSPA